MKLATSGFLAEKVDTSALDGLLNQLGRDGWELVDLERVPGGELKRTEILAVFKRPVPNLQVMSDTRGACPRCGYDLRGADHDACPECGWSGGKVI